MEFSIDALDPDDVSVVVLHSFICTPPENRCHIAISDRAVW